MQKTTKTFKRLIARTAPPNVCSKDGSSGDASKPERELHANGNGRSLMEHAEGGVARERSYTTLHVRLLQRRQELLANDARQRDGRCPRYILVHRASVCAHQTST